MSGSRLDQSSRNFSEITKRAFGFPGRASPSGELRHIRVVSNPPESMFIWQRVRPISRVCGTYISSGICTCRSRCQGCPLGGLRCGGITRRPRSAAIHTNEKIMLAHMRPNLLRNKIMIPPWITGSERKRVTRSSPITIINDCPTSQFQMLPFTHLPHISTKEQGCGVDRTLAIGTLFKEIAGDKVIFSSQIDFGNEAQALWYRLDLQ